MTLSVSHLSKEMGQVDTGKCEVLVGTARGRLRWTQPPNLEGPHQEVSEPLPRGLPHMMTGLDQKTAKSKSSHAAPTPAAQVPGHLLPDRP